MNKALKLVTFIVVFLNFCVNVSAKGDVSAKSAVVIDAYSNRILFEKDAYTQRPMASTTKIMTALVAMENSAFDDVAEVSSFASGTEGSSIWLSPGEHMTVEDLLYALMLSSGNDAAVALAEHTAGSVEAFCVLMNEKARKIGAMNTHFANPHGLPNDEHYTTAYDLALIGAEAIKNPLFRKICSTKTKTISWENSQWNRSLSNHNKLLKNYEYAIGIKTGFTKKAGRCLVSAAEKDGQLLVTVTLSDPDDWTDHINLFNRCFGKYSAFTVCEKCSVAGSFSSGSDKDCKVNFLYSDDYKLSITEGECNAVRKENVINALPPLKKGDKVGVCNVYLSDKFVGSVELISAEDVDEENNYISILIKLLKGLIR